MNTDNLRYVWAAYKRHALDDVEALPKDMERDEFVYVFTGLVQNLINVGGDAFVLFGQSAKYGRIGIGIVTVARDAHRLYPHVVWFPEASMRNRLECSAKFLVDLKKKGLVLIFSRSQEAGFFIHLGKYGILKRIGGVIKNYHPGGKDAVLFQGVVD